MTDTTDTEPDSHAAAGLAALLNLNHPIKRATSEWARAELTRDGMVDRDRDCVFDRRAWQACARYGILGASVPIAYGGTERSLVESLLMLEGLGHGCRDNGLVFGITSQMWSTQTVIANVGTEEQKEQWLPGLVSGEILGAFAITEPDSGSDTLCPGNPRRGPERWLLPPRGPQGMADARFGSRPRRRFRDYRSRFRAVGSDCLHCGHERAGR